MQVAVRPAGQLACTTATLADGTPGGVAIPHFIPVAVDATGNVTAAWTYRDGTHSLLQTATLPSGHDPAATGDPTVGWSAVATLGPGPTESAMYPDLAIGATGDAGIAYSVSRCAGCNMPEVAMYSVRRGPTGNWTAPTVASERMYYVSNPRVALDASGRATIVYFGYGVEASRENADGTWPAAGQTVLYFPVPGASDGSWSAAKRLTDPTAPVDAYASRAAVSQDGSLALVGWIDHYHFTVLNALWTFVDYRQNRAVFRYKVASCTTDRNGVGTFSGGSGRARWQLAEVVGYDLGSATFDTAPTTLCPNTLMIDFW